MATLKIVVCTPERADVAQSRMLQDGFDIDLRQSGDMVFWDASDANPADPEMIFQKHVVLIGTSS